MSGSNQALADSLVEAITKMIEASPHNGEKVGVGSDTQNGLDDDSVWIEDRSDTGLAEYLTSRGFELFSAPKDDGDALFSTYGIPVSDLNTLVEGDVVRLRSGRYGRVESVETAENGGPWVRKSKALYMVRVQPFQTSSPRLLIQPQSGGDIQQYRQSDQTPAGWTKYSDSAERYYRNPRTTEYEE